MACQCVGSSTLFILLSGNIIKLNNWNLKIKDILESYINKVGAFDYTFSMAAESNRESIHLLLLCSGRSHHSSGETVPAVHFQAVRKLH